MSKSWRAIWQYSAKRAKRDTVTLKAQHRRALEAIGGDKTRPIFHRQKDAIEAHLTIVVTALAISRYLYQKTGITTKKLVRTLRPIQEQTILYQGHEIQSSDPITPQAQRILEKLGH